MFNLASSTSYSVSIFENRADPPSPRNLLSFFFSTSLSLVVFYGGIMVRNGDMSSGELVSFLLYLQSLSDAFSSIGYIFSSLTQAVGAADKVFEVCN